MPTMGCRFIRDMNRRIHSRAWVVTRDFVLVLVLAGCAGGHRAPFQELDSSSRPAGASQTQALSRHAVLGATIRDAVARGDLAAAHRDAEALVRLAGEEGQAGPQTRIGAMVAAAKRVGVANDRGEAAEAFSVLSQRCGECHAAFATGPRSPARVVPEELPDASGMRRHQWAAARLWEGLVAPSDEAWRSGALTIAEAPLDPRRLTPGKSPHPEVVALAAEVHALGRHGASLDNPNGRAMIYAQVLNACASCHQRLGGGPSGP